jgi:hypothetical protein
MRSRSISFFVMLFSPDLDLGWATELPLAADALQLLERAAAGQNRTGIDEVEKVSLSHDTIINGWRR